MALKHRSKDRRRIVLNSSALVISKHKLVSSERSRSDRSRSFGKMTTASKIGPQDLPPPGGYSPIQTERIKLRSIIGWKTGIAAFVVTNIIGFIGFRINYRRNRREVIELRSARFALQPLLDAERDRAFLKQVRKNRDEEADLMKDYPGWVVGTYFGEPVYHTLPEDHFVEPTFQEYSIHAPYDGAKMVRTFHRQLS